MNKIKKGVLISLGSIVALLVIVIGSYFLYCWATYIDETITERKAHGFNIGETKLEAYEIAKANYQNKAVYILHPVDRDGYGPHKKISFQDKDYQFIKSRDKWAFYFDEGFFDSLKLTFENGKLVKIHRHRQNFELP